MNLKQFIGYHQFTYGEMADMLNVSLGTIRNILRGKDVKLSLAMKIQTVTAGAVTVADLLAYIEKCQESETEEYGADDSSGP
jgi:hypothetical protein